MRSSPEYLSARQRVEQQVLLPSSVGSSTLLKCAGGQRKDSLLFWPSQQVGQGVERDLYDGRRLPSRAPAIKQLIPAVPTCISQMTHFWDKPFSHKVHVKGF